VRVLAPSAPLAPFVHEFMVVEVEAETTRIRLPEPGLVLGLRYRGSASVVAACGAERLPDATLTGMMTRARRMRTDPGSAVVLARFRPGGAAHFFAEPLHELLGVSVPLDSLLLQKEVDRASAQVAEATSDRGRASALEALLLARQRPDLPDPIVMAALRGIGEARGALQIRALARSLAISQDPLEKRFRREVGASPKQFASVVRLRHAIGAYRPGTRLSRLAVEAGYFVNRTSTASFARSRA
jgi:hypothetical protein